MILNRTRVEMIQNIDVSNIGWCNEAVIFHVINGKGSFTHRISEEDDEYDFCSQLLLNGKPIIQAKYPICPTCSGMLATGYGIENIDSPELKRVREVMNSDYQGISKSFEKIKPLLGMLTSGYYVLADAKLFPTDGQGNFFYSVPNELTPNEATCSEYYDSHLYSVAGGFPAYIYPTQKAELIKEERVDEYVQKFQTSKNPPRGLAYYEEGFVCALLDGHHKACAASVLGKSLSCLTIISPDSFRWADGTKYNEGNTLISKVGFAGIEVEVEKGTKLKDYQPLKGFKEKKFPIPVYNITGRKFSDRYLTCYPTIHSLAAIITAEIDIQGDVVEYAKKLISIRNEDNVFKLSRLMAYLYDLRSEGGHTIAKLVMDNEDDYLPRLPLESAIKILLLYHNDETEQYMINYLVNHTPKDEAWDLVNSYWE